VDPDPGAQSLECIFSNEYRCSKETDPAKRMNSSIEASRTLDQSMSVATFGYGGRFSEEKWMINHGFSRPVGELYADAIGMRAYSKVLAGMKTSEEKWNKFLSGCSDICLPDSLQKAFPDESIAEKTHSSEEHPEHNLRMRQLFPEPVRVALGCDKDFELKECTP
jgi:hypothetical protein